MVSLRSAATLALLAASAAAQKLNRWDQTVYGGSGRQADFDALTYEDRSMPGARFDILLNRAHLYRGLYVQSSGGDFLTDYKVTAFSPMGVAVATYEVCGAKSNFTYVPFVSLDGTENYASTSIINIFATASRNNAKIARINEIYPIYVADEVFVPNNTSPCPGSSKYMLEQVY